MNDRADHLGAVFLLVYDAPMPAKSPQQFVAFLRGINVGGRRVSMQKLCECFVDLELDKVRSFIASGNIIFECGKADAAELEQRIESAIEKKLGFESATFLRTPAELIKILENDPLANEKEESFRRHIIFVRKRLTRSQAEFVTSLSNDFDQLVPRGAVVHWLCRGSFHQSKIKQPALTKAIGGPWTARNVQTVTKLAAMLTSKSTLGHGGIRKGFPRAASL